MRTSESQAWRSCARSPGTYRGSRQSARLAPAPGATSRSPATSAAMHPFTAGPLSSRFSSCTRHADHRYLLQHNIHRYICGMHGKLVSDALLLLDGPSLTYAFIKAWHGDH